MGKKSYNPITLDNLIGKTNYVRKRKSYDSINKEKSFVTFLLLSIISLLVLPYIIEIFNQLSKNDRTLNI